METQTLARLMVFIMLSTALCFSTGCTSFGTAWTNAAKQPTPQNTMLGCWNGNWQSEANGHHGTLRCVITQKSEATFNARFHAIYQKVLRFGYTVPLQATQTNGMFRFSGRANLGWWAGGVYQYEGYAKGTNFFSTYNCKYDHGTFQMTRPTQTNYASKPR